MLLELIRPVGTSLNTCVAHPPPVIVSILSQRAFLVGTSRLPFHPAQYASSGTDISSENINPADDPTALNVVAPVLPTVALK